MRYAFLKILSFPLECVLRLRHFLFDKGFLTSRAGVLPTLVIGNLSLGGTGKTPFSAWVCRNLEGSKKVALLSRGYGRKGKGFILVKSDAHPDTVGDEPIMQSLNLPQIGVAVCANRLKGIEELNKRGYQLVVLDDAFQHRRLNGKMNILLTRADQPFWKDHLFPFGTLRDIVAAARRAEVLVVTNCANPPTQEFVEQAESYGFKNGCTLFFTGLEYLAPYDARTSEVVEMNSTSAFGVCGIANDTGFKQHVFSHCNMSGYRRFGDHHRYTDADFADLPEGTNCIITTEKDAVKLRWLPSLKRVRIIALPIRIKFIAGEDDLKILLSQRLTHPQQAVSNEY